MKIRCQKCRKKISIDEAFAGGNCRCPYCKAITMVSGGSSAGRTDRPDRPDLPTSVVASRDRQVESSEAVPLAEPVVIQGVTRIVLLGFVLFLLVMGAILIMMYVRSYR